MVRPTIDEFELFLGIDDRRLKGVEPVEDETEEDDAEDDDEDYEEEA